MTYSDVITQVKNVFPDITTAKALEYCNQINRELNIGLPSRKKLETLNLTDGTSAVDLPAGVVRIEKAVYKQSATTVYEVQIVDRGWLNEMDPLWDKRTTKSRPLYMCVDSVDASGDSGSKLQVSFYPTPNTTTSGSYPVVELTVDTNTDVTGANNILSGVVGGELYKAGICYFHARDMEYSAAPMWLAEWERQKGRQLAFETNMAYPATGIDIAPPHTRRRRL